MRRQLLPAFGARPLDRIFPARVRQWFDRYSQTAPGGANRAFDVLRQIMNFAVTCGHIETSPTAGVRKNRRPTLTRFLSREEIVRLHHVLDAQTGKSSRQQADIIHLLLLTGCRKGEIVRLRWSEVHDDTLALSDGKTGPRKVPIGDRIRAILDRQPRPAALRHEPFRVSLSARSRPSARARPRVVASGQAGSRYRGRPSS